MSKYLNLVSYFGGKFPHLNWLLDLFPRGNYHFVDIMCGSANVALNLDYPLITVNDLNDEIINLFKVLRESPEEFTRALYFTPFSRAELYKAIEDHRAGIELSNLERARRYYIKCQLGYGANGSQNNHLGAGFEYSIQKSNYYRVDGWNIKLRKLPAIIEKLRSFQIESKNVFELFQRLNKPGNIVYFDPPYLMSTRSSGKRYKHEVSLDFHEQLAEETRGAKCFVAISGYESDMYKSLFKDYLMFKSPAVSSTVSKRKVNECLWTNYDPHAVNGVFKIQFDYENSI